MEGMVAELLNSHHSESISMVLDSEIIADSIITTAARKPWDKLKFPSKRLNARSLIRANIPAEPGVYGWLDEAGQLNYVGKAKSLRARLLQYFDKTPAANGLLQV